MSEHHTAPLISEPVGIGEPNRPADVNTVMYLLNIIARANDFPEGGKCDHRLISAIRDFQFKTLKFPSLDSRVDPNGRTLRGLVERACQVRLGQSGDARNSGLA